MTERIQLSTSADGDIIVIKSASDSIERARLAHEADVLGAIEHPNVIQMIGRSASEITLAFGGRLDLARAQIDSSEDLARIAISVFSTISEVAELGWAHRSLTPEHCVLGARGRVSICSWSRARAVTGADDPAVRRDVSEAAAMLRLIGLEIDPGSRTARRHTDALTEVFDEVISHSPHPTDAARTISALSERWTARPHGVPTSIAELRRPLRSSVSVRRRSGGPDRSVARSSAGAELSGQFGVLTICAAALGLLLFLETPGTSPNGADAATTVVGIGMGVVRWLAIAASGYGVVVACVGIAAITTRRESLVALQRRLAPVLARRVLVGVTGLGVIGSAVGAIGTASDTVAATPTAAAAAPESAVVLDVTPTTSTSRSTTTVSGATSAPMATSPPVPVTATAAPVASIAPPAVVAPAAPVEVVNSSPTWVINRGDHLWRVAERTVSARLGRHGTTTEVERYWRRLIEVNRQVLADPSNPDLVFVGQVFELPPIN